ncbi:MAG: hypothetical protein ACJ79E_02665, partial [Anaeromyxobacteraceae bacterium]
MSFGLFEKMGQLIYGPDRHRARRRDRVGRRTADYSPRAHSGRSGTPPRSARSTVATMRSRS